MSTPPHKDPVARISVSLPESLCTQLDRMVEQRGFGNRSQAVAEMITAELAAHHQENGDHVMAGTLTLFYDESKRGLQQRLAEIQRKYIDEVISSQHVLLEKNHVMEVLVVQGPMKTLNVIVDAFLACRGVKTGRLTLNSILLPPLHGRK